MDMNSSSDNFGQIPLKREGGRQVLLRDMAELRPGTMPGQYDRYNMKRQVTLTANRAGVDLGTLTQEIAAAVKRSGEPPKGAKVEIRGQIPPMNDMTSSLSIGLIVSVVAVFLLLTANFQSV